MCSESPFEKGSLALTHDIISHKHVYRILLNSVIFSLICYQTLMHIATTLHHFYAVTLSCKQHRSLLHRQLYSHKPMFMFVLAFMMVNVWQNHVKYVWVFDRNWWDLVQAMSVLCECGTLDHALYPLRSAKDYMQVQPAMTCPFGDVQGTAVLCGISFVSSRQ